MPAPLHSIGTEDPAQGVGGGESFAKRLFSRRAGMMLFRNTVVSCTVFALGLAVLWLLVEEAGMAEYPAVAISFVIANSIHYFAGRAWIFPGSERKVGSGYVLFFINAGLGLASTLALFAFMTELAGMDYLTARVVASLFAGLAVFGANALFNFKAL